MHVLRWWGRVVIGESAINTVIPAQAGIQTSSRRKSGTRYNKNTGFRVALRLHGMTKKVIATRSPGAEGGYNNNLAVISIQSTN
jgi:hypothetical protein